MERERILTGVLAQSALEGLAEGPWRFLNVCPSREQMDSLRGRYSLRGADFWHLALAMTLRKDLPELVILTFDQKLREGAEREGLA
jgi:predicted nucleic acid-binding protein